MKQKAIIVDIDGTIADLTHRLHFIMPPNKKRNYPAFFETMAKDTPKKNVIEIVEHLAKTYKIVLITGRPEAWRKATQDWLHEHTVEVWLASLDDLHMRPDDDFISDEILKARIYDEKIKDRYDVIGIFEDRQCVVDMWRKKGLTCFQVDQWEEIK